MSKERKHLYEPEILSALAGLLLNFMVIALLIGVFWYIYTLTEKDFINGFVELSRTSGNAF